MIFDRTTMLSDAQPITASAPSQNTLDLGAVGTPMFSASPLVRDIGKGRGVPFLIQVVEDFAAAGAATLQVALEVDADPAFPSPKQVWISPVQPLADLIAGKQLNIDYLPKGVDERYLRANFIVANGPFQAGNITAAVTMGNQTNG